MKKYHSKDETRMKQYNAMLELARDKTSTFYNTDGSQNNQASHRSTFWKGYNGTLVNHPKLAPKSTCISYPNYRAGMDFKVEEEENE